MKRKITAGGLIFDVVIYSIVIFAVIITLVPILYVISASFSNLKYIMQGDFLLIPKGFNLKSYELVFSDSRIWKCLYNSIWYTAIGTIFNIIFTLIAAYPLSRKQFFLRGVLTFLIAFTMFFQGGIVPLFLTVVKLGLFDTRWAIILPTLMTVWYLIICRTYIQTVIPEELIECAKLEGCSEFGIIRKVVVPLSKPIIATLSIFYAITQWNSFFPALIYVRNRNLHPLQLYLRNILIQMDMKRLMEAGGVNQMSIGEVIQVFFQMKYALIVVTIVPIMLIYPFFQKHFVRGMLIGSIKG